MAAHLLGCLPQASFDGAGIVRPGWRADAFQADLFSLNILSELCGEGLRSRYQVPGSTRDR